MDEPWGVRWQRSTDYTYAPVEGPFQKIADPTVEDLKRYKWPKASEIENFNNWREKARRIRQESDKALVARVMPGIVTYAQFLRGFEGSTEVEVFFDDARDKTIFSGFYPPRIEDLLAKGWELVKKEGEREDYGLWRCAACRWLYKDKEQGKPFESLPDDWKCPVCKAGKGSFEQVA